MVRKQQTRAPSNRQLKVGEEIRHALASVFSQGKIYHVELAGIPITVSEVRVSPDLRNATAYVMPLGGAAPDDFVKKLNEIIPQIRAEVTRMVKLKYSPALSFRKDEVYEHASKLNALLQDTLETFQE